MAEKQRRPIGARLRQLREMKGLEISDIANVLGMKRERYNHYEVDAREPSLDTVVKLAAFYDVSVDYLLCVTDVPTRHTERCDSVSLPELFSKIYFQIDEDTKHELMNTMCEFVNQLGKEVKPLTAAQHSEIEKLKNKYSANEDKK